MWRALGLALALSACRVTGTFDCERDDQCRSGATIGVCTLDGCAFPDPACPSGYRYDDTAADGGACVGMTAPPGCETWTPQHFDPCALPSPLGATTLAGALYTYDTDTGVLAGGPTLSPASVVLPQSDGSAIRVISVAGFALEIDGSLVVSGSLPLVIASWSDIAITGTLSVRSSTASLVVGAGSNPAACDATAAKPGAPPQTLVAATGGGGGGGQGSGGSGGTVSGGNSSMTPGGAGGMAIATPTTIRGGCSGAPGGAAGSGAVPPSMPTTIAAGGAGGGAIQLTARGTITAPGVIMASGAGGFGAPPGSNTGGGGGGAGGYIGLEAPIASANNLLANGGGGGGGTSGAATMGGNGISGASSATTANGGAAGAMCASSGGLGGGGTTNAGAAPSFATCASGGGGGSVGWIVIRSPMFTKATTAVITPAETPVP